MKIFMSSVFAFVMLTVLFLIGALLLASEEAVKIYALRQVHSYAYSSEIETFSIPVIINTDQTHYFLEEAIQRVQIKSATSDDTVPLDLVHIHSEGELRYNAQTYHYFTVHVRIALYAEDLVIQIPNASLRFDYIESDSLTIPIGEFNYTFEAFHAEHLVMHTRINLPYHFGDLPSSGGLLFSLENKTSESIEIVRIEINSTHVKPNMRYLKRFYGDIDSMMGFDALFSEHYHFFQDAQDQHASHRLKAQEEGYFTVPFAYENALYAVYRYPIVVHYVYQGELHQLVVDDFMFIRTHPFRFEHDTLHQAVVIDEDH